MSTREGSLRHTPRDHVLARVLHQQVNVIRDDYVIEQAKPEALFRLEQPVQVAAPIVLWKLIPCHLHQRLERSAAIERLERLEPAAV